MNKTNVGKSVFNKVGKMRLTAILAGLIVLMATALDIYADFVVTSTYAGTGNKTTASQMGISFSSTNEVVWAAHIIVNGVEIANATVMVGFKKGGWFSSNKDTARIIGSPSQGIWARVRIDGTTLTPYMYSGLPMQSTNTTTDHVSAPEFMCAFRTYVIE